MRKTWKGLGGVVLGCVLALAAPGTASAQIDCHQCTPSNYCEDFCQWGFFGEYYFDTCRNWTYPCQEYTAAAPEGEAPFFLAKGSDAAGETQAAAPEPSVK